MLAAAVGSQLAACLAFTRHGLGIHGLGHLPIINPLYNNLGCKAATNSQVWEAANCEQGSVPEQLQTGALYIEYDSGKLPYACHRK